ncbi:hypothetical protein [Pseudanabaena sp. ABRG5-3]|uniref:hypothetical protein n=1 Tax=Pseudanabaena sp. ABRG5-3 TaxID=685565 RepID=UPI000DC6D31F|nr:hypothetical protein [Pseudanabaena sp. ABRG5-3]BBC26335.1 hypothetical protein ABRG53_4078 [Pseudanabaena sp. ABRG5-3]
MTEIKEALALVPTVLNTIKAIKEACNTLDAGVLPNNRKKLKDLEEIVVRLESQVKSGFPSLANLVILYSDVASDVREAWILADKNWELLGTAKKRDQIADFLTRLPGDMERTYMNVHKRIIGLPEVDSNELGTVMRILEEIRKYLDRLKQVEFNDESESSIFAAKDKAKNLLHEISSQYLSLEGTLSKLIKRILHGGGHK